MTAGAALFFSCNNSGGSDTAGKLPDAVPDTLVGWRGCERCNFAPVSANTFDFKYQHYTIRVMERTDTVGVGILAAAHFGGPQYNIPVPPASYFMGINRDFLFVDVGTGPSKREFIIYDLRGQKELFRSPYIGDVQILPNGKVWYWKVAERASIEDKYLPECKDSAQWVSQGLFVAYGQRAIYDPNTSVQISKSEYQCFSEQ